MQLLPSWPSCLRGFLTAKTRRTRSLVLFLFLLIPALAFAALDFPALTGRVVDDAHILPPAARLDIETKAKELEEKSGIQLVVATVPSLQETDIETFANGLFRFWKLGEVKVNNGVLFLIAPNERKMRIEVGYGLEGTLTDALSKIIIATAVTPKFKTGDFGAGVERGVDGIIEVLSGDSAEWEKRIKVRAEHQEPGFDQIVPFIVFALFLFVFFSMLANARGGGRRMYRGGRGPIIYFPPSNDSWSGGSSWGGGGSFGGDGGGGFSGGGGSSGGGGASGDW
ncbi:hypothetical+protein [Methylocapsa aurea]|uniref:TPM domain-containing protein n=1 Tax=Methylocapsa aurea TaxID=663610 RepID=UPI003D18B64C